MFYNLILSRNLNISSASCHSLRVVLSDGEPTGKITMKRVFSKRNTPYLIDVTCLKRYFYDIRYGNFEHQIFHIIEREEEEFIMSFIEVVD